MSNTTHSRETRKSELERAYAEYMSQWDASSASFSAQGVYSWMADSLIGCPQVLEIGTGTGRSTLELLRRGHSLVSIDENPMCLEFAHKTLREHGHEASLILRGSKNFSSAHYQAQFRPIAADLSVPEPGTAILFEGDVCNDDRLIRWLKAQPKFDAVACWLIGTHPQRQYNEVYDRQRKRGVVIDSDSKYRFWTQNTVYELADALLRPGGRLSVVDRGRPLREGNNRKELHRSHVEQASVTALVVQMPEEIKEFEYAETQGGVALRVPESGPVPRITMNCIVSVKATPPL